MSKLLRFYIFLMALALCSAGCTSLDRTYNYSRAASDAELTTPGSKLFLDGCISDWQHPSLRSKRAESYATYSPDMQQKSGNAILLETGQAGFIDYDYILVSGPTVRTPSLEIPASVELLNELSELYAQRVPNMRSGAQIVNDGKCYFLTVKRGGSIDQYAFYGQPDHSELGSLIALLVSSIKANRTQMGR